MFSVSEDEEFKGVDDEIKDNMKNLVAKVHDEV